MHDILTKEISLIVSNFPKNRKKTGMITSLVTGITSYLHNKRWAALKKAFMAIENQVNLERSIFFSFRRFYGNVWIIQTH